MVRKLAFIAAVAMVGASGAAFAQATDTEQTTGSTTIIQGISLDVNTQLVFGTIARPTTGNGTVTITPAGAASATGAGLVPTTASRTAATYTVNAQPSQAFTVTVNNGNATFDMANGGDTIPVTLANSALPTAAGAGGTATFQVGGSFNLTSTTTTGAYSGQFPVTVAYN